MADYEESAALEALLNGSFTGARSVVSGFGRDKLVEFYKQLGSLQEIVAGEFNRQLPGQDIKEWV